MLATHVRMNEGVKKPKKTGAEPTTTATHKQTYMVSPRWLMDYHEPKKLHQLKHSNDSFVAYPNFPWPYSIIFYGYLRLPERIFHEYHHTSIIQYHMKSPVFMPISNGYAPTNSRRPPQIACAETAAWGGCACCRRKMCKSEKEVHQSGRVNTC